MLSGRHYGNVVEAVCCDYLAWKAFCNFVVQLVSSYSVESSAVGGGVARFASV